MRAGRAMNQTQSPSHYAEASDVTEDNIYPKSKQAEVPRFRCCVTTPHLTTALVSSVLFILRHQRTARDGLRIFPRQVGSRSTGDHWCGTQHHELKQLYRAPTWHLAPR